MSELEISIINSSAQLEKSEKEFRAILGNFEGQHHAKVICTVYEWTTAWAEIMQTMLYKHGPAISQAGTTWLGSLEAAHALRPFTPAEINQFGGAGAYQPAAWKSGIFAETGLLTALPWFMDTYVLCYRKDLLRKAGIDEAKAFESLDALTETVQKLSQAGVTIPFAMPTGIISRANLHNVAGWVWNYGGEFVSEDGKHLLLSDPKTRQGLKAYFSLAKHTPKAAQTLSDLDCYRVFLDGNAAMALRNTSLINIAQHDLVFAKHLDEMGVAAMPGENFVGGSSFVMWNHIGSLEERLAMELLRHITLPETQFAYFKQNGFLPSRIEAHKMLEAEPFYAPVVQALARGRSFRKIKLWGLIEDRLIAAISEIWQALYANENANVDEEIARVLDPLERRLQLTLSDS